MTTISNKVAKVWIDDEYCAYEIPTNTSPNDTNRLHVKSKIWNLKCFSSNNHAIKKSNQIVGICE